MASGILIHVVVGAEKRTEFFSDERIRIGTEELCNLQIHSKKAPLQGVWLELEKLEDSYRLIDFHPELQAQLNERPLSRYILIRDGDVIKIPGSDIIFSFFELTGESALISVNRDSHIVPFIEDAALQSATSPRRDDAKAFLRSFTRELVKEIGWATRLIILTLAIGFLSGVLYLGFAVYSELKTARQQAEEQHKLIQRLEEQMAQTSNDITKIDQNNQQIIKTVSLAPNLRVQYGSGVCLIAGVYDLVDKKSGKPLRYPDPTSYAPDPYQPPPLNEEMSVQPPPMRLTTEGNGSVVEYDFVGTGFYVGSGYILTNSHVVQPWTEDEQVQQLSKSSNGRPRLKKIVAYFPNFPQPFPLKVRDTNSRDDLAVTMLDAEALSPEIPALPLEMESSDSVAVGKAVVSMGYPNGPDRLLAMVDDAEARNLYARCGTSRQTLIGCLGQAKRIQPLTTQGAITDLDAHRIVHDAKTAEGGSGAPVFGQSAKVIGVNFGVFTESNSANMAVPIKYAIEMLHRTGWKSAEEQAAEAKQNEGNANLNANTAVPANKPPEKSGR
ncbi:MAG TPA: trypsin-like peptidase domain-containing protein [Pyrinomonadaceae bacterium]|jgi:S1-C subfamily serine protease|nr:trypsin-like peptidase domain-containing protein [Pyrinomonadaceae bacterium]